MIPQRISVKYFLQEPAKLDLPALIPVFHRWIQEHTVPGLLIDVADYKHVQDGPGIALIGHEGDYALDLSGGQPGLLYRRKRAWQLQAGVTEERALQERLRTVFRSALEGCQALAGEPGLDGGNRFRFDEAEVAFIDQLVTPNTSEQFAALANPVQTVLAELYGGAEIALEPLSTDRRRPLTMHIRVSATPDVATLLGRLDQAGVAS